jgi:SAM-dependent methyltransferase
MANLGPDQRPEGWNPVPHAYDSMVAPFTGLFAQDALRLANVQPGQRVLDVGAGTGVLSLAAAALGAEVLATDFSPGMVDYLKGQAQAQGIRGIEAVVMDGQALDAADNRFDAAVLDFRSNVLLGPCCRFSRTPPRDPAEGPVRCSELELNGTTALRPSHPRHAQRGRPRPPYPDEATAVAIPCRSRRVQGRDALGRFPSGQHVQCHPSLDIRQSRGSIRGAAQLISGVQWHLGQPAIRPTRSVSDGIRSAHTSGSGGRTFWARG